jgi:hypothetical protein
VTIKREPRLYDKPKTKTADFAGRCDILAECSGEWNGVWLEGLKVLDWKSSKEPADDSGYAEWPLQVSGYIKGTIQTYPKYYPDGGAIIRLDKETGIPTIYDYSDIWKDRLLRFEHLVRYYGETYREDLEKGIPSVTTILGILAKPALIQWAANCSRDWILEQLEEYLENEWPIEPDTVRQWANEAPRNFRKVSKVATDIGKEAHRLIELDLKGKELPKMCHVLPQVENAFEAYLKFKEAVNLKPIMVEYKLYGTLN